MHVDELVARCTAAARDEDSFSAVRSVFDELREDLDGLAEAVAHMSGTGGYANQVFYRAPNLTLLKACFEPGHRTPPHDHGTWAMILVYDGCEKNTLYATDGDLRLAGERDVGPGDVLPMRESTAHVAECLGDAPALGLHAYGGDLLSAPRRMWHPETLVEETFTMKDYERLRAIATEAAAAPLAG